MGEIQAVDPPVSRGSTPILVCMLAVVMLATHKTSTVTSIYLSEKKFKILEILEIYSSNRIVDCLKNLHLHKRHKIQSKCNSGFFLDNRPPLSRVVNEVRRHENNIYIIQSKQDLTLAGTLVLFRSETDYLN